MSLARGRFVIVGATLAWLAVLGQGAAHAQSLEVLHTFSRSLGLPTGRLLRLADGTLVGSTDSGGEFGLGSVFALVPDGSGGYSYQALHSFTGGPDGQTPQDSPILASDGNLYGTAYQTNSGGGTLFRLDPSGRFTTIANFGSPGANAPLVQADDGFLYGTVTSTALGPGSAFRSDLSGNFATIYEFARSTGGPPRGGLLLASDGNFYGVTSAGGAFGQGTFYRLDRSGDYTELHSFGSGTDGAAPYSGPIQGPDSALYGVTELGGAANAGTVFRIDLAGNYSVIHDFATTDGSGPSGSLLLGSDGRLYGTTSYGGPSGVGTVFRMDLQGNLTTLYAFHGDDGSFPSAGLIQSPDGTYYGTTNTGGYAGQGAVFEIQPDGQFQVLYQFDERDGGVPASSLIRGSDGALYGSTGGAGTSFRLSLDGSYERLHAFSGIDGYDASGGLLQASDQLFYGATQIGGANDLGTIYLMTAAGDVLTLHSFSSEEGQNQEGPLVQGSDSNLYGTTRIGGTGQVGTIYRMDTAGGDFMTLHDFSGPDGQNLVASLLQASDGYLYGVASLGGANGDGTAFRIDASGTFTKLHDFTGLDGQDVRGTLLEGTDGFFYGTTIGMTAGLGTGSIFRMDAAGNVTTVHAFSGADGNGPSAGLIAGSDGNFYGTTIAGGQYTNGNIFRADTSGNVTSLYDFIGPTDGRFIVAGLVEGDDGNFYGQANQGGLEEIGLVFRWLPLSPPPAASSVSPTSGPAGGGTFVRVSGAHFLPLSNLTIGGEAALGMVPLDQSQALGFTQPLLPGSLSDVVVEGATGTTTLPGAWFADFLDVPSLAPFHDMIESVVRSGLSSGCGAGNYCPSSPVTRAQIAVLLLKAIYGSAYVPPACTGVFVDVPCPGGFAVDWIEDFAAQGYTAGCGGGAYCAAAPVSRSQAAVLLLKASLGPGYVPPPCTGIFADVACPSNFANWIEELYLRKITSGCGTNPLVFCPGAPVRRGQTAALLVKSFGLP